jgi:hypothetical protein
MMRHRIGVPVENGHDGWFLACLLGLKMG